MVFLSRSGLARVGAFFSIVMLSALGPAELQSSTSVDEGAQPYVLQGGSSAQLAELVEAVGGIVSYEIPALDSVGVELTEDQIKLISRSALVERVFDNSSTDENIKSNHVAGNFFWDK